MISVFGSLVGQEEMDEIQTSIDKQWIGLGPKVAAFEKAFSARLGLNDFALLDSGSNSLYMAVKVLDLPPGSEVIVPSFTWISCAHAPILAGCKTVFCDVDSDSMNVTAQTLANARTKNTKAVMVVHYAGLPVDMDPILALGLPVIEDAAHAVDSRYRGRSCGGIGEVGIFSFDAVKNLTTGEGGGITSRDPEKMKKARLLRYCGIGKSGFEASASKDRWWEYHIGDVFPKMLPNDIAASIGLAQLKKLDAMQARRRRIWETYQSELKSVSWLKRPLDAAAGDSHSYFTYCIRIDGGRRDRLAKSLFDAGIYTTLRYHPLHMNSIYGSQARLPNTESLNETALSLPLHPRLTDAEVERIIKEVKYFRA